MNEKEYLEMVMRDSEENSKWARELIEELRFINGKKERILPNKESGESQK